MFKISDFLLINSICEFQQDEPSQESVPQERLCSKCCESKSLSHFYKKGERWDSSCKPCTLARKMKSRTSKKKMLKRRPKTVLNSQSLEIMDENLDSKSIIDAFKKSVLKE